MCFVTAVDGDQYIAMRPRGLIESTLDDLITLGNFKKMLS